MFKRIQIYLDTSVLNFLYADDSPENKAVTVELFENFIKAGIYDTYISDFVIAEIQETTDEERRKRLLEIPEKYNLDFADLSNRDEINILAQKYMASKIIPEKKFMDALHVAVAVTKQFPYLVSWNYRHLANVNKEQQIKSVNLQNNYVNEFRIITPLELIYGS